MSKTPVKRRAIKKSVKGRKRAKVPPQKKNIHVRYLGTPPELGTREIKCTMAESVGEIKQKVMAAFQIPFRLAIQFIFQRKVLPDSVTLTKIGFNPQNDVILVMGMQIGGKPTQPHNIIFMGPIKKGMK